MLIIGCGVGNHASYRGTVSQGHRLKDRPCLSRFRVSIQGATNMTHRGFSHIGLSTLDLDETRAFYEGVLGFKPVVADTITIEEGGHLRHMFFDVGDGQLIAFLEPNGVPDVPAKYDAGINRGLGVPAGFYHFAFDAGSPTALAKKRDELCGKVSRRQKSWTTDGRGRSISKI